MKRVALCVLPALVVGSALAHPVDEVVQGAYLTLAPGKVALELNVTPGAEVAGTVLKGLDPNGDGKVTDGEARRYARTVLSQSTLKVDGKGAAWTLDRVQVPPVRVLRLGGGILKIYASAKRADRLGTRTLFYENRYQPARTQRTANVFLQPSGNWQFQVARQTRTDDGRALTITYTQRRS